MESAVAFYGTIISFLFLAVVIVALYFIVKLAVKNGILQAHKIINEKKAKEDAIKQDKSL